MSNDPQVTALVARAANGDRQAWEALVERYAPLIWSICRRYQLGGADAGDVGQAVWLQLLAHLGELRDAGHAGRLAGHHHTPGMRPGPADSTQTASCRARTGR